MTTVIHCDERDDGRTILLPRGGELRVVLPVNRSTGHGWHTASAGAPELELLGTAHALRPEAEANDGAGGTAVFRFHGAVPGTAGILLLYAPDADSGSPVRRYRLQVTVGG